MHVTRVETDKCLRVCTETWHIFVAPAFWRALFAAPKCPPEGGRYKNQNLLRS